MIAPTKTQMQILDFIRDFNQKNNESPTYLQIAAFFSYRSITTAQKHIFYMGKKGLLHKKTGAHKKITVLI